MNEGQDETPAPTTAVVAVPPVATEVQQVTQDAAQVVEKKFNLQKYNKAIVAVLGLAATVLVQVFSKNPDVQVVVSLLTAAGVHLVPNQG